MCYLAYLFPFLFDGLLLSLSSCVASSSSYPSFSSCCCSDTCLLHCFPCLTAYQPSCSINYFFLLLPPACPTLLPCEPACTLVSSLYILVHRRLLWSFSLLVISFSLSPSSHLILSQYHFIGRNREVYFC